MITNKEERILHDPKIPLIIKRLYANFCNDMDVMIEPKYYGTLYTLSIREDDLLEFIRSVGGSTNQAPMNTKVREEVTQLIQKIEETLNDVR